RRRQPQGLRELGMGPIGHRRRMLDAIAALPASPPAVAAPGTAPTAARARDAEAGPTASAIANEAEGGVPSGRAPSRSGLTPLVGRDKEMRLLLRRWRQAKTGAGQVVLISGEAGIGKSRLAAELAARVAPEPQARARFLCLPDYRHSILYPVVLRLERAAGFADSDTEEQKLEKLEALLANGGPGDDEMQLIAELLSLPNAAGNLDRSPLRKRERLLQALLGLIEAFAEREPLLVTFEDVQWIDPTSRELLDLIIERIGRWRVMLLVTFRPEFHPNWDARPHVSDLALAPLDEAAGTALA